MTTDGRCHHSAKRRKLESPPCVALKPNEQLFGQLPRDIWVEILRHVPKKELVLSVSRVCREFRRLVFLHELWRSVSFFADGDLGDTPHAHVDEFQDHDMLFFEQFVLYGSPTPPLPRSLQREDVDFNSMILKVAARVEDPLAVLSLNLQGVCKIDPPAVAAFCLRCSNLQEVVLPTEAFEYLESNVVEESRCEDKMTYCPSLEAVSCTVLQNCSRLERLRFLGKDGLDLTPDSFGGAGCESTYCSLKVLDLGRSRLDTSLVKDLLPRLPCLQRLCFFATGCLDVLLDTLAQCAPNLEELGLGHWSCGMDRETQLHAAQCDKLLELPSLRRLELLGTFALHSAGLAALTSRLHSLSGERIHLYGTGSMVISSSAHLTNLSLVARAAGTSASSLDVRIRDCRRLEHVAIEFPALRGSHFSVGVSGCTRLTTLRVAHGALSSLPVDSPQLRVLTAAGLHGPSPQDMCCWPALERLEIWGMWMATSDVRVPTSALEPISRRLSSLETLRFSQVCMKDASDMGEAVISSSSLRSFEMSVADSVDTDARPGARLIFDCPSLSVLRLGLPRTLGLESTRRLVRDCALNTCSLTKLDLIGSEFVTNQWLDATLRSQPHLSEIFLSRCGPLTHVHLASQALRTLHLSGCPEIASVSLTGCPHLEHVVVQSCSSLRHAFLGGSFTKSTVFSIWGRDLSAEDDEGGMCDLLSIVPGLPRLQQLHVAHCQVLPCLDLRRCPELVMLRVDDCSELAMVRIGGSFNSLRCLQLSNCRALSDVVAPSTLPLDGVLFVKNCSKLSPTRFSSPLAF